MTIKPITTKPPASSETFISVLRYFLSMAHEENMEHLEISYRIRGDDRTQSMAVSSID